MLLEDSDEEARRAWHQHNPNNINRVDHRIAMQGVSYNFDNSFRASLPNITSGLNIQNVAEKFVLSSPSL